jgi:N-acetylneuraminic acid mutarotase
LNKFSLLVSLLIVIIFSGILDSSIIPAVFQFSSASLRDSQSGSIWYKDPNMPTPRSEVAGAIVDGKVYVIGGFVMRENAVIPGKSDIVEVYDIKNKTWSAAASLPQKMDHVGAAEYDGKLYVLGGSFGSENNRSNKLYVFDQVSNKWIEGKPMPTARSALTTQFIDGILYAIGGQDFTGVPVNTSEAYDPKTDTWTSKAPMPTPRHHLTSAIVDGKLYVFGGRTVGSNSSLSSSYVNLNSNEMYDPISDTWTSKAPMPSNRSGLAAAAYEDGKIYVFGGEDAISVMTFDNNEKYDPKTDKWTSENPMPTARHGLAAVFDNITKRIYVIGGGIEAGNSVSNINEVFLVGRR